MLRMEAPHTFDTKNKEDKNKTGSCEIECQIKIVYIFSNGNIIQEIDKMIGYGNNNKIYSCNNTTSLNMIFKPMIKFLVLLKKYITLYFHLKSFISIVIVQALCI